MAKLNFDPGKARVPVGEEEDLARLLRSLAVDVDSIRNNLRYKIAGREQIAARLKTVSEQISREETVTRNMKSGLEQIISRYQDAENKCAGYGSPVNINIQTRSGGVVIGETSWNVPIIKPTPPFITPWNNLISDVLNQFRENEKYNPYSTYGYSSNDILTRLANAVKGDRGILGMGYAAAATMWTRFKDDGAVLRESRDVDSYLLGLKTNRNWSWDVIGHSEKLNAGEASTEFHLAKGKIGGGIGLLSGSLEAVIGQAKAKGEVGATIYKDGKFLPRIGASAGVEATALSGTAKGQFGSDLNNFHAKATGKVGTAEAKVQGNLGVFTDDDGKTKAGVQVKAGAEAYVASGKVSGGISIFGIKIDGSLKGHIGAGGEVGGEIASSGVEVNLDAALGLGLGLTIKIDWSDFKFGW